MARLVLHEATGPYKLEIEGAPKPIWICACGLSARKPYCDGSHKNISEEEGRVYLYEKDDDESPCLAVRDLVTEPAQNDE